VAYWFLGAGLALLVLGSEAAVRGGVALSRAIGLSPLVIGLFVISLATSSPELAVALRASLTGSPDIAIGNVIGSNVLNILLILGIAALIRPMPSSPKVVLRDGGAMLGSGVALALMAWGGVISRAEGALLLLALIVYFATIFFSDWRRSPEHSIHCGRAIERLGGETTSGSAGFYILVIGVVCLVLGAHFAVAGAVRVASMLHLSQALVGLTIVALGSSLPELILTATAAARGETDLAIGHLIGSNSFNVLGVLGITAIIQPIAVAPMLAAVDVLFMVGASAILLPMLAANWRLSRPQGAMLLATYAGYLVFLAWRQGILTPQMLGLS
jgi:cation:H+ antiporter